MSYFDWLSMWLVPNGYKRDAYQKLLYSLYSTPFYAKLRMDKNRIGDGLDLRSRYEYETGEMYDEDRPCSVLEVLAALAARGEKEIMYDPDFGDRTGEWFWEMMVNMGLDALDDWHFDDEEFEEIMTNFLERRYGRDGDGGPFCVKKCDRNVIKCDRNMTKIELWYQMNCYFMEKLSG